MKVLFIHPAYPNQFTLIAHQMGQQPGIECFFLADLSFSQQIQSDGVPITYFGYHKDGGGNGGEYIYTSIYDEPIRHGRGIMEVLSNIVESYSIDVVIGHASFGVTFFIKEFLDLPVISYVELPGYYMTYCREEFPAGDEYRFFNMSFKSVVLTSVIHSNLTIVPSHHARMYFPPELQSKIRVQMEGFQLPPNHTDRPSLRKALGLPENKFIIGFVGRTLEAVRGFDIFIKIAVRLNAVRPDLKFLVIGDAETIYGNEVNYLGKQTFKEYVMEKEQLDEDSLIFRDYLPHAEFIRHLQSIDVLIFPLFEGAANWSLFEAMAAGVKILASDRAFIPEVITSGKEGFLFEPYDIDGFVNRTLQILAEPERYSYLAKNARQKIKQHYSIEKAVAGYTAIMQEAVGD